MNADFCKGKSFMPIPVHHFMSSSVSDIWQFHHLRNVFDDAFAFALKVWVGLWGCNCTIDRFIKTFVF